MMNPVLKPGMRSSVRSPQFEGLYRLWGPKARVQTALSLIEEKLRQANTQQRHTTISSESAAPYQLAVVDEWSYKCPAHWYSFKPTVPCQSVTVATTPGDTAYYRGIKTLEEEYHQLQDECQTEFRRRFPGYRQVPYPGSITEEMGEPGTLTTDRRRALAGQFVDRTLQEFGLAQGREFPILRPPKRLQEFWESPAHRQSIRVGKVLKLLAADRFDAVEGRAIGKTE